MINLVGKTPLDPVRTGGGELRPGTPARTGASDVRMSPAAWTAALGPPVDVDRITALRAAISEGRYAVDPGAVAAAMIAADLPVEA